MQCVVYKNGNSGAGLEIPTRKVAVGGGGGGGLGDCTYTVLILQGGRHISS